VEAGALTRGPGFSTALALSAIGLGTVAVGLALRAADEVLGAPLPPFFAYWDPAVAGSAILWIPLFGLSLAGAIALVRSQVSTPAFLLGALALALALRLSVTAARDGVDGWYSVFGLDPEAGNEYLPVLPAIDSLGVGAFLDRFAELAPTLPIHPSAHPPGTPLLIHALGIEGPRELAALVIGIGALAVPLTYGLARRVDLVESRARAAALLLALSPAAMLLGVTSTDAMFCTAGVLAAWLLLAPRWPARVAGGVVLAAGAFLSWALLAVGVFAAVVTWARRGLRDAVLLGVASGLVVLACFAVLHAATGFDPIGSIRSASEAYDLGISNARPYLFWLLGSPVAFAVALGLPTAWYAARALGTGDAVALGLAAIVVASVLIGVTKAETERIWLFMGPLAAVAAARVIPLERMPVVLSLLAAQALASSLLLDTIW
jgi:hypothetical protein